MKQNAAHKNMHEKSLKKNSDKLKMTRATVSLPRDVYKNISIIAKTKKVSIAWVMRDAAEKYIKGHDIPNELQDACL